MDSETYYNTLQHTATARAAHCNTLQNTATHCNTPQHTALYLDVLANGLGTQRPRELHRHVSARIT